ncbi:hypothetical protein [Candidatus Uabimicrobium amorphum]|uniref:hypothetical protein n=1 Tax=Uabimicrobium amorphum TaxID=2596890 RepID=UPI00125F4B0A|nr:hypothetical protein [Candidatus Uabimicrobium amorphum]
MRPFISHNSKSMSLEELFFFAMMYSATIHVTHKNAHKNRYKYIFCTGKISVGGEKTIAANIALTLPNTEAKTTKVLRIKRVSIDIFP